MLLNHTKVTLNILIPILFSFYVNIMSCLPTYSQCYVDTLSFVDDCSETVVNIYNHIFGKKYSD